MAGTRDRTWGVLTLVGCALVSLALGNWVTFSAEPGEEMLARGVVALALLITAVLLSLGQPKARRTLGAVLVVLVLALVGASYIDGFRFVWESGEPRSFAVKVFLAVIGMWLLTPAYLAPGVASSADLEPEPHPVASPQVSPWAKSLLWFVTAGVVGLFGHNVAGAMGLVGAVLLIVLAWGALQVSRARRRVRS